ncbi:MAG: hypothetical protein KDD60_07445, partial [Bdellovibrionales bacterium]|nr:hypothetical protein [Bdellovibrionales bacterium]
DYDRSQQALDASEDALQRIIRDQQLFPVSLANILQLRTTGKNFLGLEYVSKQVLKISYFNTVIVDNRPVEVCITEPIAEG